MPTYARREGVRMQGGETLGSARYARLESRTLRERHAACRLEILADGNFHAHGAAQRTGAQLTGEREVLLRRFQLDHARHAARAAVVRELERMDRPEGLAQHQHAAREGVEVARAGE